MSTNYPTTDVNKMLEQTIQQQEQSLQATKMLYQKVTETEKRIDEKADAFEGRMDRHDEKMTKLHKQINDENRLLPSELDELTTLVKDRAVSLAQRHYPELDGKDFRDEVGKMKARIWRKLNKRFQTSKYIHTKRKDFSAAQQFIRTFDPMEYV